MADPPVPAVAGARRFRPPANVLVIGSALFAVTIALFSEVRTFAFLKLDDLTYVSNNPAVSRGLTAHGFREAFFGFRAGNWDPLTWISHMLDVSLFGLDPGAHHLANLAWHAAGATLLFFVLRAATAALWPSALVAALFALHPLHVESFAWVAERKGVLCGFFWIAAMGGYVAYARRPGPRRYAAALLLFSLALMSKPIAATLPAALLLLDFWPLGRLRPGVARGPTGTSSILLEKIPFALLSVLTGVVSYAAQSRGGALDAAAVYPFTTRLANAVLAYGTYLGQLAWPADLSVFYPMSTPPPLPVAAAGGVLVLITAAAIRWAYSRPALFVGWFFYLGTLVPVSGIIQVGSHARADRHTYIPAIGIFLALVWLVRDLLPARSAPRATAAGVALLALAALGFTARSQLRLWRDTTSLFTHALAVDSGNYVAHFFVGNARLAAGDTVAALEHYRTALRLRPDYPEAGNNLGAALASAGRLDEALAAYRSAVVFSRNPATTAYNLSLVLEDLGRVEEARRELEQLVRKHPDFAPARRRLQALEGGSVGGKAAVEQSR